MSGIPKNHHANRQMEVWLNSLSGQISEALLTGRKFVRHHPFVSVRKVLFYGMGGSAIGGDVLRAVMTERSSVLFSVYRQGRWSRWVDEDTLVVFSSYSGDTWEMIDVLHKAVRSKARLLVVTSGGRLAEIAQAAGVPCLKIPSGMPPRCALGYLTFSLLPVMEKVGGFKIPAGELKELLSTLKKAPKAFAKRLAAKLQNRILHLYTVSGFMEPAAARWRAEIAENAKMLASHHLLPEMFHNEIEGWQYPKWALKRSAAIFLTDKDDSPVLRRKIQAAMQVIRKAGALAVEVPSKGKSRLARLFSLISAGDWTSYELALKNGADPVAIPAISAIKKVS